MLFLTPKVVDPLPHCCTSLNAAHLGRVVEQVGRSRGLVGLATVDLGLRGVGCHHFADLVLFMFQQLLFLINSRPLSIIHCQSTPTCPQRHLPILEPQTTPVLVSLLFLGVSLSAHTLLSPILAQRQHKRIFGRFHLKDLAQEIFGLIKPILLLLRQFLFLSPFSHLALLKLYLRFETQSRIVCQCLVIGNLVRQSAIDFVIHRKDSLGCSLRDHIGLLSLRQSVSVGRSSHLPHIVCHLLV